MSSSSGGDDLGDLDDSESQDDDDDSEGEAQAGAARGRGGGGGSRAFAAQLRERLRATPFDKELHAALIGVLREAADLDRLQAARREAAARVALPEALWLEWLQDERTLASDDGRVELEALHARACAACPSGRIWLARCSLLQDSDPKEPQGVRACYEEALKALGLHPTEGPEIWAAYREYEEGLLASLLDSTAQARQAERVRALFLRQLALPLPGTERLQEALASFEGSLEPTARGTAVAAKAEAAVALAAPLWEQRAPLERRLREASRPSVMIGAVDEQPASPAELLAQLLALEEASGDQARIMLGHLRLTQSCPQEVSRWLSFADAARAAEPVRRCGARRGGAGEARCEAAVAHGSVLDLAVHHCPHVGGLWLQLHEDHEAAGMPLSGLRDVLDRGLLALDSSSGARGAPEDLRVTLLCQHADACRRAASAGNLSKEESSEAWAEMRATLEKAVALSQAASSDPSSACQVLFQWLRLEGYGARSAEGTIAVGKRLMEFWGSYYHGWSQFIMAVHHCQEGRDAPKVVRGLYREAIAQVADYPEQVRSDWVQFEHDCGTLESWKEAKREADALQKAKAGAAGIEAAAAGGGVEEAEEEAPSKEEEAVPEVKAAAGAQRPKKQRGQPKEQQQKASKKREEEAVAKAAPSKKRRKAWPKADAAAPLPAAAAEVPAPASGGTAPEAAGTSAVVQAAAAEAAEAVVMAPAGKGTSPEASVPLPESGAAVVAAGGAAADVAKPRELPAAPAAGELPPPARPDIPAPDVPSASTDAAKEGAVKQKEVVAHGAGGDVEQGEEKSTKEPHKGSHYHQKRFATNEAQEVQEKEGEHTVYVANLDWSVDEAQLYRLFGDIEGLKEVRLVRDFLQRSKGFAYIDFEARENVEEAVAKLDGREVHKRPLKVAPSKPTKPLFEERTLFVKNVPASCGEAGVKDAFVRYGEVVAVRMPIDPSTKVHKGYAYVDFAAADALEEAVLGKEEVRIAGQLVQVTRSIPMKDHRHQKAAPRRDMPQRSNQRVMLEGKLSREDPMRQSAQCPTTIHVKDLAFGVDEEALKEHFSQCGEVQKVLVVRNHLGHSRGFGFVDFADSAGAQAALLLADSTLKGRSIVVSKSTRKITQKKPGAAEVAGEEAPPPAVREELTPAKVATSVAHTPVAPRKATEVPAADAALAQPAKPGAKRRINLQEGEPPPRSQKVPAIARGGRLPFRTARELKSVEAVAVPQKPMGTQASVADTGGGAGKPMSNADFRALLLGGGAGDKS